MLLSILKGNASELLAQGGDPMDAKRLTGHRSDQAFKRYVLRSEQATAISAFYGATLAVFAK
ncbi:MAG: hypothetical protein LH679_18725 [Cyanobacteria bacterium CAN_BIN43]|nr:hypothetical protein [Cyanobacteria bacterium CAN_BIN43]